MNTFNNIPAYQFELDLYLKDRLLIWELNNSFTKDNMPSEIFSDDEIIKFFNNVQTNQNDIQLNFLIFKQIQKFINNNVLAYDILEYQVLDGFYITLINTKISDEISFEFLLKFPE